MELAAQRRFLLLSSHVLIPFCLILHPKVFPLKARRRAAEELDVSASIEAEVRL